MVSHLCSTRLKDSNKYIYIYILFWVTIGPEVAGPMEPEGGGFEVKKTRLLKGAISGFGVRLAGQVRA